jgi:hypothetical protein
MELEFIIDRKKERCTKAQQEVLCKLDSRNLQIGIVLIQALVWSEVFQSSFLLLS